jgi:hypothetical protein
MDSCEKYGLTKWTPDYQNELFHYTSLEGLIGILDSNEIWATHIEYLNDSSELRYALELARNELKIRLRHATEDKLKDKIECLLDELDSHSIGNISISCLTEERDLLSQWRAYGGKGAGFSIGFNVSHLMKLAITNQYQLVKVEYDLDKQKQIISRLIDDCLDDNFNTSKFGPVNTRESEDGTPITMIYVQMVGGNFIENLYTVAPCLKDASFGEEREWRIISRIPHKDANFRINKAMLVPYNKILLGNKIEYLKSITVGPNHHENLMIESVRKLMLKYAFDKNAVLDYSLGNNIKIHSSRIPYRDW